MKRVCETCAAWEKEKSGTNGHCFATPRDMVHLEQKCETGPSCRCLQWTPRQRGTCGECEWFYECSHGTACLRSREFIDAGFKSAPGCGDWMPKEESE